jgi:hypothetical protein
MLSLVLIVVVVANVVLWSYQMNQLDWEKMREDISIANVTRVEETWSYNPSEYTLGGSTRLVSGNVSSLISDDSVYMVFRSYATALSNQTLYAHQETTLIAGTSYYLLQTSSADAAGTNLSYISAAGGETDQRRLFGKFVYPLSGVTSISASTWTIYYRQYYVIDPGGTFTSGHYDVDILIRQADGTIRTTIATDVATSGTLTTLWSTISGTYDFQGYTVVDQTDYLEIDFYVHQTSRKVTFYLRIDDNTLTLADQTRIVNVYLPSEYTSEVEFTGASNTQSWTQLSWTIDSSFTTDSVTVTLQLYNYQTGQYPTSGDGFMTYTLSDVLNTDEIRNQTITINPTDFRNATGHWMMRVKGIKATNTQFDFKVDWIEFKVFSCGTLFTFKNRGPLTSRLVSLWVINSAHHLRHDIDIITNSGETLPYFRADISLPTEDWMVKVVTERGNIATYQENTM